MVLNIFPKRREPEALPPQEPEFALPEPSPELLDEPRARRPRGTRGGRGRGRAEQAGVEEGAEVAPPTDGEEVPAPAPRARRPRRPAAVLAATEEMPPDESAAAAVAADVPPRRERSPRREAGAPPEARGNGRGRGPAPEGDTRPLGRAGEPQARPAEGLARSQDDGQRRSQAPSAPQVTGMAQRVGIFVDAANIELACDRIRSRGRIDWSKVLDMLTRNRQLVRAIAYSPVHDDPSVSIETQRFVEPFLDKGYKVVTKALKRFQDGTIKANVDIELALDVVSMLDRLDVVCLVSGDGDFTRLIEFCQARGVRVEVISVGSATATNLKYAADLFIDLQARMNDVRV